MVSLLRSARFVYQDGSASIRVDLRRHHDLASAGQGDQDTKRFVVTRMLMRNPRVLINKTFGTYPEACRDWDTKVKLLEDEGMRRADVPIVGFHDEG